MSPLKLNDTATAEAIVTEADLASSLASALGVGDPFPGVYATPRLVALMELASARLLQREHGPGELSVGVSLEMFHTAATLPGAKVTATARYVGRDGKLFVIKVTASDPAGEIGHCTHKRAIVCTERLMAGAEKRRQAK
jgi:predicted thioesterase